MISMKNNPQTKSASKALADNILSLRTKKKLSQRTVSKLAGIGSNVTQRMEAGSTDPCLSTIEKVGKVLGVDPCRLLKP
jgi:transcriptional regulator with XRE-family HTH domain